MKTEMKMNDLEAAIKNLEGHTLALCKDGNIIVSDKRGVAPSFQGIVQPTVWSEKRLQCFLLRRVLKRYMLR